MRVNADWSQSGAGKQEGVDGRQPGQVLRLPGPESGRAGAGRWSSRRKTTVIPELLRGADLESTSRKYRVTVATPRDWQDRFLAAGEAGIKSREVGVEDEEKRRLKHSHLERARESNDAGKPVALAPPAATAKDESPSIAAPPNALAFMR